MVSRDGWTVHAWHGTGVPASLIEDGWDFAAILAEPNTQVRRCAIERIGWDVFGQHLVLVADAADPGNPGQVIALYELPSAMREEYGRAGCCCAPTERPKPTGPGAGSAWQCPAITVTRWPLPPTCTGGPATNTPSWPAEPETEAQMPALGELITQYGVAVEAHLDRDADVPVLTAPQIQGDISDRPVGHIPAATAVMPIPAAGIVVATGRQGYEHRLLTSPAPGQRLSTWSQYRPLQGHLADHRSLLTPDEYRAAADRDQPMGDWDLIIGFLTVPHGGAVYLAHDQHGYLGIGPAGMRSAASVNGTPAGGNVPATGIR